MTDTNNRLEVPQILDLDEQLTAVVRFTIPRAEIVTAMGEGRMELIDVLAAQGIAPIGPWFSRHYRMDPAVFDFEVGLPVASAVEPSGRVRAGSLPAGKAAVTIYRGPYEELGAAWGDFMQWLEEHGHQVGEGLWEHYATDEKGGLATVLCRPVV